MSNAAPLKKAEWSSTHESLCYNCTVCSCEWIRAGKPVPGWDAVPTRQVQHINKGGMQVLGCPKFEPMQERKPRRRRG